jgi:hypothetical protein
VLKYTSVAMLVLLLLPTIVGYTPLASWIANRAAADVNGRVEFDSASLAWFSPIKLYGLKIVDPEDRSVIEVSEVHGDRSLAAMLWNAADLGRFRLEAPKFTVVLCENGSNLRDVFAKYLTPGERKPVGVAVEIADGSISIEDTHSQRSWQIDRLDLDFNMPADRSRPWELKTSGRIAGSPRGGAFELAMRRQQADKADAEASLTEAQVGAVAPGPDFVSVRTEGLSLGVIDLVLRRAAPGVQLAGRLSGSVEYRWDSKRPDRRAMVKANAVAEDLGLAGSVFGGDRPSLARLRLDGAIVWKNGLVEFDRVTAESDIGSLSLTGTIDVRSHLGAAVRQGYEIAGQLDLARLAAILPNTLGLQKNVQITSGRAQLAVSGRPGEEGTAWQGRLEVSNFAANKGGWPVAWQRPILVTLAAKQTSKGPVIESLKWESGFLKMQASGTPSHLRRSLGILLN